jgi:hypothetical protein
VKEAALRKAANKLSFVVDEIPHQAVFAKRYANRVSVMEGLLRSIKIPRAQDSARAALRLPDSADLPDIREAVEAEREISMLLMEALGYGPTPIRASHGPNKGRFHGMHGTERAARTKGSIKGAGVTKVACPHCSKKTAAGANCAHCGSHSTVHMGSGGSIAEGGAVATAPAGSPVFNDLHPRAAHGQFGTKGGAKGDQQQQGGAQGAQPPTGQAAAALIVALKKNDPQVTQADLNAAAARVHHAGQPTPQAVSSAGQALQALGYANDHAGIAQFQRENDMPVSGQLDAATLATVQNVYGQNARTAKSRMPDFTGIPGSGAKVSSAGASGGGRGTPAPKGRSTLGKTAQKNITLSAEQPDESGDELRMVEAGSFTFATTFPMPPTGTNHANGENGGERQPGGDDIDFDEIVGSLPPNLRTGVGATVCGTCVHFSRKAYLGKGGCMMHSVHVHRLEVCDDYTTLTPPDATLRVFESRLQEAEQAGVGYEIVRARAAVKTAREQNGGGVVDLPHPADECLAEAIAWETLGWSVREIQERTFSSAERRALAARRDSIKDGTFPIASRDALGEAIGAWDRSDNSHKPALKRLLLKSARKLEAGQAVLDRIGALSVPA